MLGKTIYRLRKAKNLTQKQVAHHMGVTPPAVTQWETGGGIDLPNLKKLAKVLGVSAEVLIRESESDQLAEIQQDNDRSMGNNASVLNRTDQTREAAHMTGDEGLGNEVLKHLLRRMDKFEEKLDALTQGPATTRSDPRKRRRR